VIAAEELFTNEPAVPAGGLHVLPKSLDGEGRARLQVTSAALQLNRAHRRPGELHRVEKFVFFPARSSLSITGTERAPWMLLHWV